MMAIKVLIVKTIFVLIIVQLVGHLKKAFVIIMKKFVRVIQDIKDEVVMNMLIVLIIALK